MTPDPTPTPRSDYTDFEDQRIKHLEMIQAVVTRLSNEGFLLKGWAITVATALFGLAVNSESWTLALLAIAPTLAFWFLDTTFLRSERLFRALHSHVQQGTGKVAPFFMGAAENAFVKIAAADPGGGVESIRAAFWRPSLRLLYGTIVFTAIVLAVVLWATSGSSTNEVSVRFV